MEYINLIMRYMYVSIEYLRLIASKPWTPEFLLFTSILGILLYMVSSGLWTTIKKWVRGIGIIFITFGLGSIMIAIFFGMDVQFTFLEESSSPWSKTAANNYLKESWRESYKTKVALPEPLIGGNQQKPVRKTLSPKSHMKSVVETPDELSSLAPPEGENIRKVGNQWTCEVHGKTMIYDNAKACWKPQKK